MHINLTEGVFFVKWWEKARELSKSKYGSNHHVCGSEM